MSMMQPYNPMAVGAMPIGNPAKPGYILTPLGPVMLTWDASGWFNMQNTSPFKDTMISVSFGKQGGFGDKFLQACLQAKEQIAQCAAQAGVMYSGDLPSGAMPGGANVGAGVAASSMGSAQFDFAP